MACGRQLGSTTTSAAPASRSTTASRGADRVEARERERRGIVAPHDAAEVDAVVGEHPRVRRAEAVVRQAAEERDRLPQPADRAGGVEGAAAGMAREAAAGIGDEVVERLAADEDRCGHARRLCRGAALPGGSAEDVLPPAASGTRVRRTTT
jgi:hypothetical protein